MKKNNLFNRKNKKQLIQEQLNESFIRKTCSFYRYVKIGNPQEMRNILYKEWLKINILGRIYIAKEGINAQISVPEHNWKSFVNTLDNHPEFSKMFIKPAVKESNQSFIKLIQVFWFYELFFGCKVLLHGGRHDSYGKFAQHLGCLVTN